MATAAEKLLLRLEWKVVRRLDGRLQGMHRTAHRGSGIDFTGLRAYSDGDDARLAAGMRRAGVPVHRVDTDRDLAEALVEVVARTRDRSS